MGDNGRLRCQLLLLLLVAASAQQPTPSQDRGYAFEYGVRDEGSGTAYAHTEFRDGHVTTGQYTVHLPDGRIQTVKYTADQNGYRATVSYDGLAHHPDKIINEPSRTVNFPPILAGRPIPVVGAAVLNRPSTIPSHATRHNFEQSREVLGSAGRDSVAAVQAPVTVHKPPTSIETIPIVPQTNYADYDDSVPISDDNYQETAHRHLQPLPQLPGSYANTSSTFRGDGGVTSAQSQQFTGATSFERHAHPASQENRFSHSISESGRYHPLTAASHQHQDLFRPSGRFPSISLPSGRHPSVQLSRKRIPVVPFTADGIPVVPPTAESAPLVPPQASGVPVVPTVPFPPSDYQQTLPLYSIPFQSHSGSVENSVSPPFTPHSRYQYPLSYHSFPEKQPRPLNFVDQGSFSKPHELPSQGEQNFNRVQQPFGVNSHDSFATTKYKNFNDFYKLPSSSLVKQPRKFPPNTYIPSALDPLSPQHGFGSSQPTASPYGFPGFQYGTPNGGHLLTNIEGDSRPFVSNNILTNSFDKFPNQFGQITNLNDFPNLFSNHQSQQIPGDSNPFSGPITAGLPHRQNSTYSVEGRPTPQPFIVSNYVTNSPFLAQQHLPDQRWPVSGNQFNQNLIFKPINEINLKHFKKPFIIDPDASVFHNEPSVIVDYSRRASSYGGGSNTVGLAAPYVVVGGTYSPNPASKFSSGFGHVINPNSFAAHGIAPPDAADAGNVRLSPGFLPPHLAKLHGNAEEIRTSPTPEPVQLKLSPRRNLDIDGIDRKNLPLRDLPHTFGEGSPHNFFPNSLGKSLSSGEQIETASKDDLNSPSLNNDNDETKFEDFAAGKDKRKKSRNESKPKDLQVSIESSSKIESRPVIRNG
ncbi:uncharacterized protein LOC108679723 [Hyalella azteca]|uniref:Uncharacterized protein LOC108679723 n=1 Tax=Hyalella azteca TaxID=294128 RepID=A0A979FPE7_HYAAZ|nr:uncharacterized protein LOC108679723 [Hyalella azteca]